MTQRTIHPDSHCFTYLAGLPLSSKDSGLFEDHAKSLFQHQFRQNTSYRNYCLSLKKSPETVESWQNIPAVVTDIFKSPLPCTSFSQLEIKYTFKTSGTTADVKGEHHFPDLRAYEDSIKACWVELNLPHAAHAILLTPEPEAAIHSSLSHMMGVLAAHKFKKTTWVTDDQGLINFALLTSAIQQALSSKKPLAILGTALSFLNIFENLVQPVDLPEGSWAMETGGYKGTDRHMEKSDLYDLFTDKLGLDHDSIINEYSMTELSSQFYTRGLGKSHTGPSWTRIRVIDPATEQDAAAGEPGYLVIYDLANVYSVMAIRTQDIAIATGDNSFILIGRDPSALPRGCSRAADSLLQA